MRIISRRKLAEAARAHPLSEAGLDVWYRIAKSETWTSLQDVRKKRPDADAVKVGNRTYTIFNIGGNNYRLIVKIEYLYQQIYVKEFLTHAEYSKGAWKK